MNLWTSLSLIDFDLIATVPIVSIKVDNEMSTILMIYWYKHQNDLEYFALSNTSRKQKPEFYFA
jgi:hypothetical protein